MLESLIRENKNTGVGVELENDTPTEGERPCLSSSGASPLKDRQSLKFPGLLNGMYSQHYCD